MVKVIASTDGIIGRKKLQKIIFIMKKLGYRFEEKFTFHFYGPYSEELSLRVEELTNLGFISEMKEQKSNYYQYRYEVTERGKQFLEQAPTELTVDDDLAVLLKNQSSRFLELVSTMLYFDNLDKEEVNKKVQEVKKKSNYTESDIEEAWDFIHKISLKQ
nr:YwgA family protein [Gracilibacillus halotolerans]